MPNLNKRGALVHLASGESVPICLDQLETDDDDELLDELVEDLTHRPSWQVIGDAVFFTGAVSAITLD